MNTYAQKAIKFIYFALFMLLSVVLIYIGYLYATYIDDTVNTGSAYGFTIGQSKHEAYRIIQNKYRDGEISKIDTIQDRESEHALHPWLNNEFQNIHEVKERFNEWSDWSIWNKSQLLAIVKWDGDYVSWVGKPRELGGRWQPENIDLAISRGDSYEGVFQFLQELKAYSKYKDIALKTGWMARRQPTKFTSIEYKLIETHDNWTLVYGKKNSYFDTITLAFENEVLIEIHRHRQNFELP